MKYLLIISCVCIVGALKAQSNIKVGQEAPDIHITDWIVNKPQDTLLKNKFIVLEFWASWCSPCIKAVPHMNALQDSFDREDLYFISITDESPKTTMPVLRRIPFSSVVVSDQSQKTHIEFGDGKKGLKAIPMTVLIDNRNIIQWIGRPRLLTQDMLEKFLAGNLEGSNTLDEKSGLEIVEGEVVVKGDMNEKPSHYKTYYQVLDDTNLLYYFDFKHSPNDSQIQQANRSGGTIQFTGYQLIEIITSLSHWTDEQVIIPDGLKDDRYSLLYKNAGSEENASIIATILNALELKQDTISEKTIVYQVSTGDSLSLDPTTQEHFSTRSNSGDNLILKNIAVADMVKVINDFSPVLIEMEDSVNGNYDFVIKINSLSNILKSLEDYGFRLEKVEKEIDKLNLDYRKN